VLVIVVVSTVGTYVYSSKQAPRFRSSTQFIVSSSPIDAIISGGISADSGTALDQAKLLLSEGVSDRVRKHFGTKGTSLLAQSVVTADPVASSSFIQVNVESGSADGAAAVANAYVQEYFAQRNQQVQRQTTETIRKLRAQLAALPRFGSGSGARSTLQQTIRQLQTTATTTPLQTRQTNPATVGARFAPTPRRDAGFALAISLALGIGLAFVLERFDRRIRNVDDIATLYGAPLLSIIPHSTMPVHDRDGKPVVPDTLREPFRSLRTNVQLASTMDRPIKRIVVASAVSGEGKSTIVRNLALTYLELGLSVVVVEADLRRPTLSTAFAKEAGALGLTAVLTGACSLNGALQEVEFDATRLEYLDRVRVGYKDAHGAGTTTKPTSSRLMLLPSGDAPANPQAIIDADKTRSLLAHLAERFDIVLIDTPPLLAVSDAMTLLPQADGVVLVTRVGHTQRAEAQRAAMTARLDPSVRILGVVANDLDYQPGSGYGYGYGYGYGSSSNGTSA
jgi:Mrp family chromosome partitioning ATPase/capsular polysaccharide biosynthesis protein